MNYYSENDPKAAAWLRELIKCGHIPNGHVDERSITEVLPDDLAGYHQCHFFAGIAGWSLALDLAEWPEDRSVWTGSCPCQPFSAAGKGKGADDERHLWPVFFDLIRECRPECVFGEQVANAIGHGWLDGISADLEREGYACGAAVLGAHSVGAPHIRQRLFWVADTNNTGPQGRAGMPERAAQRIAGPRGMAGGVADSANDRRAPNEHESRERGKQGPHDTAERRGATSWLELPAGDGRGGPRLPVGRQAEAAGTGEAGGVAYPIDGECEAGRGGCERQTVALHEDGPDADGCGRKHGTDTAGTANGSGRLGNAAGDDQRRLGQSRAGDGPTEPAGGSGAWSNFDIIPCRDGKARRIESGTFPLAHGISGRVGLLRGYGNAIVPPLAAEFIKAFLNP